MPALSIALVGRGSTANDGTGDSARDGGLKLNRNARLLEALAKGVVISATTTAQPVSPTVGDLYIIPSGKTGTDWSAMTNGALALYAENDGSNAWFEITPAEGWRMLARDTDLIYRHTGSAWTSDFGPVTKVTATGSTEGRSLADWMADLYNVKGDGAIVDGSTDDSADINTAYAARDVAFHPSGISKIVADQITVNAGQIILGIPNGELATGYGGSVLQTQSTSGKMLNVTGHGARIQSMCLELDGTHSALYGVYAATASNTDDVDLYLFDVTGKNLTTMSHVTGRALTAVLCNFAGGVGAETMFSREWPASGVVGDGGSPDLQTTPWGFRKDVVALCHGHGISTFLDVNGSDRIYYRALLLGNLMDIGGRFFEGATADLLVVGNFIKHSPSTIFLYDAACENVQIVGNKAKGTPGDLATSPSYVIRFQSTVSGFVIQGNDLGDSDGFAIFFEGNVSHGTISGNLFQNYGQDATGTDPAISIATGLTVTGLVISGNTFKEGAGSDMPVHADGATLLNCKFTGNSWDTAKGQFVQGAFLDGGGNEIDYVGSKSVRNEIDNGDFQVAQRGAGPFTSASTPANNDSAFLLDRWRLLSDGNDIVDVSQETTTVPTGSRTALTLDVETANKKFAVLQMLPYTRSRDLVGNELVFSVQMRKGGSNATLDTMKIAIVTWLGTADAPDADPISAWEADGVDVTLKTNWNFGTPLTCTLTTSFQTFRVRRSVSSGQNVGVLIWCDNGDATVADLVHIGQAQLERGLCATAFKPTPYEDDERRCKRFFRRITSAENNSAIATGRMVSTSQAAFVIPAFSDMFNSPNTAAAVGYSSAEINDSASTSAVSAISLDALTDAGVSITMTGTGTPHTSGSQALLRIDSAGYVELSKEI